MQYRIKIENYKSGKQIIRCQFNDKVLFLNNWVGVNHHGDAATMWKDSSECDNREEALKRIDLHFSIHQSVKEKPTSIEFEYVNK